MLLVKNVHTLPDRCVFNFYTTLCRRRFVDGVAGVLRGVSFNYEYQTTKEFSNVSVVRLLWGICGSFEGIFESEIGGNGRFLRLGTGHR